MFGHQHYCNDRSSTGKSNQMNKNQNNFDLMLVFANSFANFFSLSLPFQTKKQTNKQRNSFLLLPFLITLVLFLVFMCGLAVYLIAWCPFDNSGDNFVCSIAVVLGAVCFAGD